MSFPLCKRNLRGRRSFKGEVSVFPAGFACKVQTLIEPSVLDYFPLNLLWPFFQYFHLSWLLRVIIVRVSTIHSWWCTSYKGELFVCFICKFWTLFKISFLSHFHSIFIELLSEHYSSVYCHLKNPRLYEIFSAVYITAK